MSDLKQPKIMKVLYYVILYRPKGLKVWTPVSLEYEDNPARNYFASEARAKEFIADRMPKRCMQSWLERPKKTVPNEFKVGEVIIEEETTQ